MLAIAGCGGEGELAPQVYPGAAEQLLTEQDVEQQTAGTPQAALLRWWRSSQFAERNGFLRGFSAEIAERLVARVDLDRELEYFAGGIRVTRPEFVDVRIAGDSATVFTMLRTRQPIGSTRFVTATRPQAFPMVNEGDRWRLADQHFFQAVIAPLAEQRASS